jgi:hypothetical protein
LTPEKGVFLETDRLRGKTMFEELIHKTLDGLKKRLVDRKLMIQGEMGRVEEVGFSFNEPATEEEIQDFNRRAGFRLPDDYRAFLRQRRGRSFPAVVRRSDGTVPFVGG